MAYIDAENKNIKKANAVESQCIKSLKKIMCRFEIPIQYYGILGYKEDAICLDKNNDCEWSVYEAERGNHYNSRLYEDLRLACLDLIGRISESEIQKEEMLNAFNQSTENYKYIFSPELEKNEIIAEGDTGEYHVRKKRDNKGALRKQV